MALKYFPKFDIPWTWPKNGPCIALVWTQNLDSMDMYLRQIDCVENFTALCSLEVLLGETRAQHGHNMALAWF